MTPLMALARAQYDKQVRNCSRFWGEPAYVAYYWKMFLDGHYDDDFGRTIGFTVSDEDREMFPELRDLDTVYLFEDDMGFVHNTTGPGDDGFEMPLDW